MPPEHVVIAVAVATVVAITRLVAFAIDDDKRWPRFRNLALFVVSVVLAVATGWWLLGDGGLQTLLHDFATASTAQARSGPR